MNDSVHSPDVPIRADYPGPPLRTAGRLPEYTPDDDQRIATTVIVGTALAVHFHGRAGEPTVTIGRYDEHAGLIESVSMTIREWDALAQQAKFARDRAELDRVVRPGA